MKNYIIKMENGKMEIVDAFEPDNADMIGVMMADYFMEEMESRYSLSEDDRLYILGEEGTTDNFTFFDDENIFFDREQLYFMIDDGAVRYSVIW